MRILLILVVIAAILGAPAPVVQAQEGCQILFVGDSTFRFCEEDGNGTLELIQAPEGVVENLRYNQHVFPSVGEPFEIAALVVDVINGQNIWYKLSEKGNLWYRYFGVGEEDLRIIKVSSGLGWSPLCEGHVLSSYR